MTISAAHCPSDLQGVSPNVTPVQVSVMGRLLHGGGIPQRTAFQGPQQAGDHIQGFCFAQVASP